MMSGVTKFASFISKSEELQRNPDGLTWRELRDRLSLPSKTLCPEWVKRLECDIDLTRERREKDGVWFGRWCKNLAAGSAVFRE
jgi:hypothetical protein